MNKFNHVVETVPITMIKEDEEFKSIMPPNNSADDIEKSLRDNSQIQPLAVDKNYVLIDGYTRLEIMRRQGYKEVEVIKYDFDAVREREKAYELIWSLNGARRMLDKNQKLAIFQKLADSIAKLKARKNNANENKILSDPTVFLSETGEKSGADEYVVLEDGTKIRASEYEAILRELDEKYHALSDSEKRKMAILRINAPWLLKYVTDQRYRAPLNQVFEIYSRAKELNILDKLKDLPPVIRDPLISTREGRKILLEDKYKDLLEKILNNEYTADRAIAEVKMKEAEKKARKKKPEEGESGTEESGDAERPMRGGRESDEEEEIELEELEGGNEPTTRLEVREPEPDITPLFENFPELKDLVDQGKVSHEDAVKIYEVWKNLEAIYKQASLLWYNSIDRVLQKAGVPEKEREALFNKMTKQYCRLFPKEEIFPKDVLEGRW